MRTEELKLEMTTPPECRTVMVYDCPGVYVAGKPDTVIVPPELPWHDLVHEPREPGAFEYPT
jgi:hypothetical protein